MEFKQYQKLCKKELKQSEIGYINKTLQNEFENNKCKPFWRYIKAMKQEKIGVAPLKRKLNLFSESKEKAQILVEQFYSVFTKRENKTLPNLPKCNKFDLPSLNITTTGIEKLLKKINVSKSVGPDSISNAILKNCASQLAPGLSAIFQKSVDSGELPEDWVNENASPVFKKGDVPLAENYK